MLEKSDVSQNARRVLKAFPDGEIGAQISSRQLVDHFIASDIAAGDCVRAIRHAVHLGWIGLRPENQIILREAGLTVLLCESPELPVFQANGGLLAK
jgi:hypothetical protein